MAHDAVTRLADLIEHREGSVVSKVLAKSTAGNVTLFAFDGGEGLSEHTAPFEALVYAVAGTAEIGIGTERHHIVAGDLARLPPNVPHWITAREPLKMLLIMLREPK